MSNKVRKKPTTDDPFVAAIVYGETFAVLSDGSHLPIVSYIDAEGEECDEKDAVACVAGSDELGWWSVDLGRFNALKPHEIN